MNPKSASTLLWVAVILIFIGIPLIDPAATFMLFVMAAISAVIPTLFSRTRSRIGGGVALIVSVVLAVMSYPAAERHMGRYTAKAKHSEAGQVLASPQQEALPSPVKSPATKAVEQGKPANRKLLKEVATLFARFDEEYGIPRLGQDISLSVQGARIRGIDSYDYTILKFGEPAFDLKKLRSGQLPYHVQGDFDCDGKEDRAVLLDAPKRMLVLSLGKGDIVTFPEYNGDALEKGHKGYHLTVAGKGYGTPAPEEPKRFESHCDFVSVHWWMKSSYAVAYDPKSRTFLQFWMTD